MLLYVWFLRLVIGDVFVWIFYFVLLVFLLWGGFWWFFWWCWAGVWFCFVLGWCWLIVCLVWLGVFGLRFGVWLWWLYWIGNCLDCVICCVCFGYCVSRFVVWFICYYCLCFWLYWLCGGFVLIGVVVRMGFWLRSVILLIGFL